MKNIRAWMVTALGSALMAACGGGDPEVPGSGSPSGAPTTKGNFTSIVSFGDSLSDAGTYAPATSVTGNGQPPYFGGKFTTNNGTVGTVWVENLAATLGLTITVAEMGFAGSSVACPVALQVPSLAATCTAYGQGGARVTNPNGIGHSSGALTVPVVTQIQNHLAKVTTFKATDLILVWAGNNDVFTQFQTFAASAAQIQTAAATGQISADEASRQLFHAQTVAQDEMKKAAQELTGYIRNQILAKGGKYVAVLNLPDISLTPFGTSAQVAPARSVLIALVDTFNLWLRDGLTNQPVQIIDQNAASKALYANPASYGIANNTIPACDATKIAAITSNQITDGSSLFCNATPGAPYNGLRTTPAADVNTWFFADSVHPTTLGHKLFSDGVTAKLQAFGWI